MYECLNDLIGQILVKNLVLSISLRIGFLFRITDCFLVDIAKKPIMH